MNLNLALCLTVLPLTAAVSLLRGEGLPGLLTRVSPFPATPLLPPLIPDPGEGSGGPKRPSVTAQVRRASGSGRSSVSAG